MKAIRYMAIKKSESDVNKESSSTGIYDLVTDVVELTDSYTAINPDTAKALLDEFGSINSSNVSKFLALLNFYVPKYDIYFVKK